MSSRRSVPALSQVLEILSEHPDDPYDIVDETATTSLNDDRDKQVFTDAVNYCIELLRAADRITDRRSEFITDEATLMGHEMFERLVNVGVQMDVVVEEDDSSKYLNIKTEPEDYPAGEKMQSYSSIVETEEASLASSPIPSFEPIDVTTNNEEIASRAREASVVSQSSGYPSLPSRSAKNFDDKHMRPSPVSPGTGCNHHVSTTREPTSCYEPRRSIPLDMKMKVVTLAREETTVHLRHAEQLNVCWESQVNHGATRRDKYKIIRERTYERFLEARARGQRVSSRMLRNWSVQVARELYETQLNENKFKFVASKNWCIKFRKSYGLRGYNDNGYFAGDEPLGKRTIEELQLLQDESAKKAKK